MPARKIRSGHRSVRGLIPSRKVGRQIAYESTIERDLFILLEMNDEVQTYTEQPITLLLNCDGHERRYTPDALATYIDGSLVYYEVKEHISEFDEPLRQAMNLWCEGNGASFEVVDVTMIRTDELKLAKFLFGYLRHDVDANAEAEIYTALAGKIMSIQELMNSVSCSLADVYSLIAHGKVICDSTEAPNLKSKVRYEEEL